MTKPEKLIIDILNGNITTEDISETLAILLEGKEAIAFSTMISVIQLSLLINIRDEIVSARS